MQGSKTCDIVIVSTRGLSCLEGPLFYSEEVMELYHHGILGQKWGKRNGPPYPLDPEDRSPREKTLNSDYYEKSVLSTKGKDGTPITIEQLKKTSLQKLIARGSRHVYKKQMNTKIFEIKIGEKRIGDLELYQESPTSVNVPWLGIDSKQRGNGYATASLMTAAHECKERGYKTMTLEVPGNSPDARHIYEKLGFVAGKQISEDDDVWGGLTSMKMDLTKYDL